MHKLNMWASAILFVLASSTQIYASGGGSGLPVDKVYGVNLGSWLVLEPWMLPQGWAQMGGDLCFQNGSCADCAASEFDLVKKLGQEKADDVFQKHWETWFNQDDVNAIVDAGLNTVRIPIGYWIIEELVNRETEFYPRGGLKQLKRGLKQLRDAGIYAMLDFHAMPGVSSSLQMFAGRCTTDVQFYTPPNYFRALQWAAVMTFISHIEPAFKTVFAIEAVNEPLMDATKTPGYGEYLKDFALVMRAMESTLGIACSGVDYSTLFNLGGSSANGNHNTSTNSTSYASASSPPTLDQLASQVDGRVREVLQSVKPILDSVASELGFKNPLRKPSESLGDGVNKECLHVTFMDVLWQQGSGPNPADAALGPTLYDDHLYYSFGGVADPNPMAYLTSICNLPRIKDDTDKGNRPLIFGEWGITANFNATDEFLTDWADAQKLTYTTAEGWFVWSYKIEPGPNQREWDYFTGLQQGHYTRDPAQLHNPNVCDKYRQ